MEEKQGAGARQIKRQQLGNKVWVYVLSCTCAGGIKHCRSDNRISAVVQTYSVKRRIGDSEVEVLRQKCVLERGPRLDVVNALHVRNIRAKPRVRQQSALVKGLRLIGKHVVAGKVVECVVPHECTQREQCRSEEHTSELQSPCNLVCRLLLEKKKNKY